MSEEYWKVCDRCAVKFTEELIKLHNSFIGDRAVCPKCSNPSFYLVKRDPVR